jgi:hypothetical protein
MNTKTHLETSRLEYLDRQKSLYESVKPELVDRYLGEFIAFEDGRVLDHDLNERSLIERVYRDYGYRDLLIKQVWLKDPHLSVAGMFSSIKSE